MVKTVPEGRILTVVNWERNGREWETLLEKPEGDRGYGPGEI